MGEASKGIKQETNLRALYGALGLTSLLPTAAWVLQGGGRGQRRDPPARHSHCFLSRTEQGKVRQRLSKCPYGVW